MREIGKLLLLTVLVSISLPAAAASSGDDFEAYRRQQQQGAQEIKKEFQAYKDKQDAEFADFLKSRWREFATLHGRPLIRQPEPKHIPVYVPPVRVRPAPLPKVEIPAVPPALPAPPPLPPVPKPAAANTLEVNFYGNAISVPFDPQWKDYRLAQGDKPAEMSAFWSMMSGSRYEPAMQAVDEARHALKLDDWAYVTLWRSVAQALQPERTSEQNLLLWYFLVKSGYDVRMGYAGEDVHLFVAVRQQVYSTKFIKVGEQTYYAALALDHGDSISRFYTYEAAYPGQLRALDIRSAAIGFTRPVPAQRKLSFNYKGNLVRVDVPYDRGLVEYLDTFPQSDFELYFNTESSALFRQLLPELKKYTAAMNQEEAVDFLLAFVQKSFAYKTDEEQFGHEKSFFVEESMYFPYNDCKEHSVVFAWLVRELLGLRVIGLVYPGHLTTAVELKQIKPEFATVEYQGSRYVIADPTYIGAPVGAAMPSYAKLQPERVVKITD
jgi:hypothetical protein